MQLFQGSRVPIKAWVDGVEFEESARKQVENVASMPFVFRHVAVMPDVHWGMGATVGSVIATKGAIIPAAVGVDIGCGMMWQRTSLKASDLPTSLSSLRETVERTVPVGFKDHGEHLPGSIQNRWQRHLLAEYTDIITRYPRTQVREAMKPIRQLGTLGGGNHFIEIVIDEQDQVGIMLHSGSRGGGNVAGNYWIDIARKALKRRGVHVPDSDLAWFDEGTPDFDGYVRTMLFWQRYASQNREAMMERILTAVRGHRDIPTFTLTDKVVNCHHNYAFEEMHFGEKVWVTRKGAVRAGEGDLGIIPGSMGASSYIVRGKGNPESFMSCSHGAGRRMSRGEAKRSITLEQHRAAVAGVECRVDIDVIDESPAAYKSIDAVLDAERDLVDVVHTLRQVVCVKG